MFWIILMVTATVTAVWPSILFGGNSMPPAAATAPVESIVPPIHAPPRTGP
jgi:hypothetical protein